MRETPVGYNDADCAVPVSRSPIGRRGVTAERREKDVRARSRSRLVQGGMSVEVEEKILVLGVPTAKPSTLRKVILHRVHTRACPKGVLRNVDADDIAAFQHVSCLEIVHPVAHTAQAGADNPSFNGFDG